MPKSMSKSDDPKLPMMTAFLDTWEAAEHLREARR